MISLCLYLYSNTHSRVCTTYSWRVFTAYMYVLTSSYVVAVDKKILHPSMDATHSPYTRISPLEECWAQLISGHRRWFELAFVEIEQKRKKWEKVVWRQATRQPCFLKQYYCCLLINQCHSWLNGMMMSVRNLVLLYYCTYSCAC